MDSCNQQYIVVSIYCSGSDRDGTPHVSVDRTKFVTEGSNLSEATEWMMNEAKSILELESWLRGDDAGADIDQVSFHVINGMIFIPYFFTVIYAMKAEDYERWTVDNG